jgi:hypothetical protein
MVFFVLIAGALVFVLLLDIIASSGREMTYWTEFICI